MGGRVLKIAQEGNGFQMTILFLMPPIPPMRTHISGFYEKHP